MHPNSFGCGRVGAYISFKNKKIISRTKFESAQKRDASEFIPMVERLGLEVLKENEKQKKKI